MEIYIRYLYHNLYFQTCIKYIHSIRYISASIYYTTMYDYMYLISQQIYNYHSCKSLVQNSIPVVKDTIQAKSAKIIFSYLFHKWWFGPVVEQVWFCKDNKTCFNSVLLGESINTLSGTCCLQNTWFVYIFICKQIIYKWWPVCHPSGAMSPEVAGRGWHWPCRPTCKVAIYYMAPKVFNGLLY